MFNDNESGKFFGENEGVNEQTSEAVDNNEVYVDKTLICQDCGEEFTFTAGEQEFFASKGFKNEPKRCKSCRDYRKSNSRPAPTLYSATCASCGGEARVPFKPSEGRDVYCSECFEKVKEQSNTMSF